MEYAERAEEKHKRDVAGAKRAALARMPKPNGQTQDAEAAITNIDDIPAVRTICSQQIEYVHEPEVPEGSVVMFSGDSGSGKSSLVTALAGKIVRQGRRVLVLDRENPSNVVQDRLDRLGVSDGLLLKIWGGWLPQEPPEPGSAMVLNWVRTTDPKPLVVVDSLIAFHGGGENSSTDTRAFMRQLRAISDLGGTVVVLHHNGKSDSAKDYRGSSDFKAAIDVGFHVTNWSQDARLDVLRLRCFKSRHGFTGELVYRYADGRFLRDQDPDAPKKTSQEVLIDLLRRNPGIQTTAFEAAAEKCGVSRQRARDFLNGGVLSGEILRETGSKNQRRYYLREAGNDLGI
jgi:predicted ATP-dependent serine protease